MLSGRREGLDKQSFVMSTFMPYTPILDFQPSTLTYSKRLRRTILKALNSKRKTYHHENPDPNVQS